MDCKFVTNGLAIDYFGSIKPCCVFRGDEKFQSNNKVKNLDLSGWHRSNQIIKIQQSLSNNIWPNECSVCEKSEAQGIGSSIRLNGLSAYDHYSPEDITLEIRGGSVCNFACQTCWPQASSRVAHFYKQANINFVPSLDMDWNFDLLDSLKHRLRDIILLGGEPFYDKRCLAFLRWLQYQNLTCNITIFTNGSTIDWDFIENFAGKVTLVFSIDAIGAPAEYIRFGTVWTDVEKNYQKCRRLNKIHTRINITTSPYNYVYLGDLLEWIVADWPEVVSFGFAAETRNSWFMDASVYLPEYRSVVADSLNRAEKIVEQGHIEPMQKINAINCLRALHKTMIEIPFDPDKRQRFRDFIITMDHVKKTNISNYCPEIAEYFDINPTRLDNTSSEFLESDR